MSLTIDSQQHENNVVVIAVGGEVTFENSDQFREKIDQLCEQGKYRLVIDLAGLQYMSSAGMGVLVHGLKKARAKEGDLRLINLSDKMRRVFLITQFTHHFTVLPNIEEAIKSFSTSDESSR
ncbi:MAG: STAS domain-containing protein [Candidatus Riflebacteria bacterium]|nr:STAS domain-containing protein [Candidatus Riflebacteria bacterium]